MAEALAEALAERWRNAGGNVGGSAGGSAGGSVTKARGGGSRQGRLRRLRPPRCAKARTRAAHASQRGSSKRHDIVNPLRPRRRRAQEKNTKAVGRRRRAGPRDAAAGRRRRPPPRSVRRPQATASRQRGEQQRGGRQRGERQRAAAWRTVAAGGRRPQAAAGGHPPQAAVHVFSVYEREWGHPSSLVVLHILDRAK